MTVTLADQVIRFGKTTGPLSPSDAARCMAVCPIWLRMLSIRWSESGARRERLTEEQENVIYSTYVLERSGTRVAV